MRVDSRRRPQKPLTLLWSVNYRLRCLATPARAVRGRAPSGLPVPAPPWPSGWVTADSLCYSTSIGALLTAYLLLIVT